METASNEQIFPSWEDFFRSGIGSPLKSAILWSLDNGYLNLDGMPIDLHSINRESLLFFKSVLERNQAGVLIYPSPDLAITPLLALEALYYRLHESRLPSGRDRLMVFSGRVELRREIRDNFSALKANSMPLYLEAFPLGRITIPGDASRITKKTGEPKLLISPGSSTLPNSELSRRIFGAIVEATPDVDEERAARIVDWAKATHVPFLFVVSPDPPTSMALSMIKRGKAYWGWDTGALADNCARDQVALEGGRCAFDTPFSKNFREIKNRADGIEKVIVPVKEDRLNQSLIELRKTYLELMNAAESARSFAEINAAKRLLSCIYAFEEITSPMAYAEIELEKRWGAIPVRNRIVALANICVALREQDPLFASLSVEAIENVNAVYSYLSEKKTGKHPVILQMISEAIERNESVLFVSKNRALEEALKLYLEIDKGRDISLLNSSGINFASAGDMGRSARNVDRVDTCVLYGCPRYYQRDILTYAKAHRICILAYESEIPSIKCVQDEIDDIQKLFSLSARKRGMEKLFGTVPRIQRPRGLPRAKRGKSKVIVIESRDAEMGDFTPEAVFSKFLANDLSIDFDYANEAESSSALQGMGESASHVAAVKVALPGGRSILLRAHKHVQIFDESTEKVKDRRAGTLKKGDHLILVENSTRKSLADSIIGKIESHPSMTNVIVFQKAWSHHLRSALEESGDTFEDVIAKLAGQGARTPRTPSTIFLWISGATIGPRELENIRRIGRIYNKPFLVDHYDDIRRSVKRLRSIHQSLAARLDRLIPQAGVAAGRGNAASTVIDEELDLYLEDFSNSISIERVESVEIVEGTPVQQLDRVVFML